MLKISAESKIFVHCPAGAVTGGIELLHQLVDSLRRENVDARIVYSGAAPHLVPADYSKYQVVVSDAVELAPQNVEVFDEGDFHKINFESPTQKFLWWISVDNFYPCCRLYLYLPDLIRWSIRDAFLILCKRILFFYRRDISLLGKLRFADLKKRASFCGYQAEYIQNYLHHLGFPEMAPLKDYINVDHNMQAEGPNCLRRNIVVYNPRKGMKYTRKIINRAKDISFVPIEGMNRAELIELLQTAKVYIDFGNHPGKDRLPRECAMNGCCVITGVRGSAAFFEDVPIPKGYKFDQDRVSVDTVVDKIRWTLEHYEEAVSDFRYYRNRIATEKKEFDEQVRALFKS